VESQRKNPFTINGFSVGKLLWDESFSGSGRINSQVKTWFQVIRSYALDSALAVLTLVFGIAFPRLTLPASSSGGKIYHYEKTLPSIFGINAGTVSAAMGPSAFISGHAFVHPAQYPIGLGSTDLSDANNRRGALPPRKVQGAALTTETRRPIADVQACDLALNELIVSSLLIQDGNGRSHQWDRAHRGLLRCFFCRSESVVAFR
jgi:hypothetical protein